MKSIRPRITILIANLPAERDRRVIRECLTLEAAGYDVTVIAPRGDPDLTFLPGSRDTRLRPYPVYVNGSGVLSFVAEFLWSFLCIGFRLTGEVVRGGAHAVQVCNPPDVYWPLALVLRALGRPWVFDHHDLCPEVFATRSKGKPNRLVFKALEVFEWLTLHTASAVFATNESFRDNGLRRGLRPEKLTVVRNGPTFGETRTSGEAPTSSGIPTPSKAGAAAPDLTVSPVQRIVYVGVLGAQDNVDGALLAVEELIKLRGRKGWRMTIVGDGEMMQALTRMSADRGLGDVVEFTGWLDASGVDAQLRGATVALQPDLPTRMNDLSTMAKTVEYLARGVPVVAADLLETRRTAAEAAEYVPNGTPQEYAVALDKLLDDPARRERMRGIALDRFAGQLAWEHQAEQYVAVWNTLLARRLRRVAAADPASAVG